MKRKLSYSGKVLAIVYATIYILSIGVMAWRDWPLWACCVLSVAELGMFAFCILADEDCFEKPYCEDILGDDPYRFVYDFVGELKLRISRLEEENESLRKRLEEYDNAAK